MFHLAKSILTKVGFCCLVVFERLVGKKIKRISNYLNTAYLVICRNNSLTQYARGLEEVYTGSNTFISHN